METSTPDDHDSPKRSIPLEVAADMDGRRSPLLFTVRTVAVFFEKNIEQQLGFESVRLLNVHSRCVGLTPFCGSTCVISHCLHDCRPLSCRVSSSDAFLPQQVSNSLT